METDSFGIATVLAGLLWFLALYHLCLLFALCFAWLSFSDLDAINTIAKARSGFEVAFTSLQFVGTIWAVCWACDRLSGDIYKEVRLCTLKIYIQDKSSTMSNIRHRKYRSRLQHLLLY
jgi:hypothetical protein